MQVVPMLPQPTLTLEGLPTELIILILFHVPDIASLKSFVFSSPIFHSAYLAVRQALLCNFLKTQYAPVLDLWEVITAVRSDGLCFHSHREEAISLLDTWRRRKEIAMITSTQSNRLDELKNLEETVEVFRLYGVFNYFLEDYTRNLPRPTWLEPTQWQEEKLPLRLSVLEKRRFLRALCRLQIFGNIFGIPERDLELSAKDEYWDENWDEELENEAYSLFFRTMPLWEYEEIGCVWSYLITKYDPICKQISIDLHKLADESGSTLLCDILPEDQRPPSGCQMDVIIDLDYVDQYFDRLASIGPSFLYRVLHAEHLLQRNMVMTNARDPGNLPFLGSGHGMSWDDRIPCIYPADRHEAPNFQHLWSTLLAIDQPNLGWKKAFLIPNITESEELSDVLFYTRWSQTEWDWGYAIWDSERLEEWQAPLLKEEIPDPR